MRSFLLPCKVVQRIFFFSLFASMVHATNWSGGIITDADSNIDTNFFISGQTLVNGPVHVAAVTRNVTATVSTDAVLQSMPGDGRIFISAAAGRTVFFDLTNADLTFLGSTDKVTQLLVSFAGAGQLEFVLGNDQRIAFAADELTESAGTNFFVVMNNSSAQGATVTFTRADDNDVRPVEILVGRDSLITYLADSAAPAVGNASIQFNPANVQPEGEMKLRVLNRAGIDISGHLVDLMPNGTFTNNDVHFASLGGNNAFFTIFNSEAVFGDYVSNLTLINQNYVFPHLRSEPFCDDSFTGHLTGFVLGANGVLTVEDSSYLNYVGAAVNNCLSLADCDSGCEFTCTVIPTVQKDDSKKMQTRDCCLVDIDEDDVDTDELLATLHLAIPECNVCGNTDGGCECVQFTRACVAKTRNASAFFVDGVDHADCTDLSTCRHAEINLLGCSAIYFRSGVDACGAVNEADDFIINPMGSWDILAAKGSGNVVFDVEGYLVITGSSADSNAIRILSDQVRNSGCPVIIEDECACPTNLVFPALTHAKDFEGQFFRYNKASFLINNRLEIHDASLIHTDDNHHILDRDDLDRGDPRIFSEPTYIGGEFKTVCKADAARPTIALYDAIMRFHTSAGFTGVDIQVPNDFEGNESALRFYSNGFCVDRGNGRILILGTSHGDRACGTGALIDHNAHLDVFQITDQPVTSPQVLRLQTRPNDPCFTVAIDTPAPEDQDSVQIIYLGNESNISIGTAPATPDHPQPVFTAATTPTVIIDGAYFAISTQGGSAHLPELAGTLGEGAIFVDTNGVFENTDRVRASIGTMVVRSGNGVVDLPGTQVFFDSAVGVQDWQPNMNVNNVLVRPGETFSDFTIDWMQVIADCTNFVPYIPALTPIACESPVVTVANVTNVPTILGTVDQLQIVRSRLGDQATLLVGAGGFVRELVFLPSYNSGVAPMATLIVEDWGRIGLGSAKRNYDSNDANIVLGVNGVTVIANGNGVIELNEDIIINNVCHIVPGPAFGVAGSQTLTFFSDDAKEFRVKSTGVLDLSAFKGPNQLVEFGGNMRIVFEPGAKLLLSDVAGGANRTYVLFTDTTSINFERVFDTDILRATVPNAIEDRTVKIIGNGDITMNEGSTLLLPNDTFLAIESDTECTRFTDVHWNLLDQATFNVGDANELGGTFQVGNRTNLENAQVNFELVVNGIGAEFQIRREGLVLFGVGGVSVEGINPNNYTYECLSNVGTVSISVLQGIFTHNQIFPGDNPLAALLVVGPAQRYDFNFDVNNSLIRGGGNLALVSSCPTTSPFFSIDVLETNGAIPETNYSAGLFASKDLLQDGSVTLAFLGIPPLATDIQSATNFTPDLMYRYLRVQTYQAYAAPKATIALNQTTIPTLGYVTNNTVINRRLRTLITNSSGIDTDYTRSVRRGAVNVALTDSTGAILNAIEISGAV